MKPMGYLAAAMAMLAAPCLAQQQTGGWTPPSDPALVAKARAIHERVMTADTHVDISPGDFLTDAEQNYAKGRGRGQVDVPRMEKGGLDAVFLIVYVGQGDTTAEGYANAHAQAIAKFNAIHRLVDTLAPNRVGLALTAADARRIYASGRKVVFIGVENGYPIGKDITNVRKFYELGGRYMSLAHNGNSQLSDSNTGEAQGFWYNDGLSPLGRDVIREMNRLGMMVDFSHPSKGAMMEMIKLSKAPIIGSHSGVRAICNHSRNADDEQLRALKENGGVIQLVAFASYVKCDPARDAARNQELTALRREFGVEPPQTGARGGGARGAGARGGGGGGGGGGRAGGGRGNAVLDSLIQALPPARRTEYQQREAAIMAKYPPPTRATVSDFADHIDYVKKLIGVDYIGISSDFDGGGGVDGWNSAEETFNVTLELVRRGYTEEEIAKIWSGNLLRVLEKCEQVAKDIQSGRIRAD
jgi:membrane dipeptidase